MVKAGSNVAKYIYDGKYWLALNNANEIGLPENGTLGNFKSCKDIKRANPYAKDGMYTIDPDGEGGNKPFKAYCDMSYDGGGWTKIIYGPDTTLDYLSHFGNISPVLTAKQRIKKVKL